MPRSALIDRALLRAAAAATVLALGGIAAARAWVHPAREAQWIVGAGVDGTWLVARIARGDSGLVARGQVTSRVAVLPAAEPPVESRAVTIDAAATLSRAGGERIEATGRGVSFEVGAGDLHVRGELRARASACPPPVGDLAAVAAMNPGPRGGEGRVRVIDGAGASILASARGSAPSVAIYVFSPGVAIGIDPRAECPAWSVVDGTAWSGISPPVVLGDDGSYRATAGALEIGARPAGPGLVQDTGVHVLLLERWMAAAAGFALPEIRLQPGVARISGVDGPLHALIVTRGSRL